jgi:hypothetical protein
MQDSTVKNKAPPYVVHRAVLNWVGVDHQAVTASPCLSEMNNVLLDEQPLVTLMVIRQPILPP